MTTHRAAFPCLQSAWPQPIVGVLTVTFALSSLVAIWAHALQSGLPTADGALTLSLALGGVGAIVVAYRFPIHVHHQTKVLLVTLVYYLLAVLVPPPLAALAVGLGALAGEVMRRPVSGSYLSDIASEVGRRVLMVLPAALVAHLGVGATPSATALVGAALVLAALDIVSLPLVTAPMAGDPPRVALVAAGRATILPDGLQYLVGIVGAAAAVHYPWTLALLLAPCAVVYGAFKAMSELHDGTRQGLESMADAVDLRDPYTGGHSKRVTAYSAAILREVGLCGPEVELIVMAARVHDIGKIGTPDAILNKTGTLTREERAVIEEHPVCGAELLRRYRDFAQGVALVRHHHESWDGTGYPDRLAGSAIPFGARVIAVADSFDAMTSDRPYRAGMTVERAAAILRDGRDRQWDARLVDAFLRTLPAAADQTLSGAPDALAPVA